MPPGVAGDIPNLASAGFLLGVAGLCVLDLGGDPNGLGGTQCCPRDPSPKLAFGGGGGGGTG